MKSGYVRICRLLASSGYRADDIAAFLDETVRQGPGAVLKDISGIREIIHSAYSESAIGDSANRVAVSPRPRRAYREPTYTAFPVSDTAMKVERLLVFDAGMPRGLAVEQLTSELRARFPDLAIPSESRKGFHLWIHRLTAIVPEKELLHIATNMRNRWVHDMPTDWRLK